MAVAAVHGVRMTYGGQLDRRITIQRQIVEEGEYGDQPTNEWEDVFARIPAQVWDSLPGNSESVQSGLRMADRPARVRIRYLRGITSDMRVIVHNETDEVFQISGGPAELGRRQWIEMTIRAYST